MPVASSGCAGSSASCCCRSARGGTPAATNVESYIFALAVPALAFSAWLAYASWFVLHVVCLLCLATYVAVAGVFLVTGFAPDSP